jgi:serine/threonine-protein phosphatase 2A regulatory subunit B
MSIKLWDTAMESKPLVTISVQENLVPILTDLYESECIFDKFEVTGSANGDKLLTGSYRYIFLIVWI